MRLVWDALVVAAMAGSLALYFRSVARLRARSDRGIRWWESAAFVLGWATIAAALLSRIDTLSDVLFSEVAIRRYGCGSCHTIPGVPGAVATVGPPLDKLAMRTYLAGRLANNPRNLMRWIRQPKSVDPKTAIPDVGITERDGRDIAAYLYTLK